MRGLDSHLSYRIGLKTFSASESRQVLGITDAYQLPSQPGAGFLKSDVDTVTRFQASYVSGPIMRRHHLAPTQSRVRLFTSWEEPKEEVIVEQSTETLIDAVVARAISAAKLRG